MVQDVFNSFGTVVQGDLFKTTIPFTNTTVGDALDFATSFANQILNPLRLVAVEQQTQGSATQNEVQSITIRDINAVNGGTFTLSFGGKTTTDITYDSNATNLATSIKNALNGLTSINTAGGSVDVLGDTLPNGLRFTVTFKSGNVGNTDLSLLKADTTKLKADTGSASLNLDFKSVQGLAEALNDALHLPPGTLTADYLALGSATLTTVQAGVAGTTDEILKLVENGTSGSFKLTIGALTTDDLAFDIKADDPSLPSLKSAIENLSPDNGVTKPFAGKVTVTQDDKAWTRTFTIVLDKSIAGQPLNVTVDTTKLGAFDAITDAKLPGSITLTLKTPKAIDVEEVTKGYGSTNEVLSVTLNDAVNTGGTGDADKTFRLGFADANGVYFFTTAVDDGATADGLKTALKAIKVGDNTQPFNDGNIQITKTGSTFTITFMGNLGNKPETLRGVAAADELASVPLNLNLALGSDLASIKVNGGSLMIWGGIDASLTLGIDLTPSTHTVLVAPPATSPSTSVSVTQVTTGVKDGSSAVVDLVIKNANVSQNASITNSGTFKLGFDGARSAAGILITELTKSTLQSDIDALLVSAGFSSGLVTVDDPLAGDFNTVFQVHFDKSLGDISSRFTVIEDKSIGPTSVGANEDTKNANGQLLQDAHFSLELFYDEPGSQTVTVGNHASDNTIPAGTVHVALDDTTDGGNFTLTFDTQTTDPIDYQSDSEAVQKALTNLSTVGSEFKLDFTGQASANDTDKLKLFLMGSPSWQTIEITVSPNESIKDIIDALALEGNAQLGTQGFAFDPILDTNGQLIVDAPGGYYGISAKIEAGGNAPGTVTANEVGDPKSRIVVTGSGTDGDPYVISANQSVSAKLIAADIDHITANGSKLTGQVSAVKLDNLVVATSDTDNNASVKDLVADVQQKIDDALIAKGYGLGFLHTGELKIGNLTFTAPTAPTSVQLPSDIPLAVTTGDGVSVETKLRQKDITQAAATLFTGQGALGGTVDSLYLLVDGTGHFTLTFNNLTTTPIQVNGLNADSVDPDAIKNAILALDDGQGNHPFNINNNNDPDVGERLYVSKSAGFIDIEFPNSLGKVVGSVDQSGLTLAVSMQTVAQALANVLNKAASEPDKNITLPIQVFLSSGKLEISLDAFAAGKYGTLQIDWGDSSQHDANFDPSTGVISPIMASAPSNGGPISLRAPSVTDQIGIFSAPISVDGSLAVTDDPDAAFSELGIVNSPTQLNGQLSNSVTLTLVVNGTKVPVFLDKADTNNNTSIDDLVTDLQTAVNNSLGNGNSFSDNDVIVRLVPLFNGSTNTTGSTRIEFVGKNGVVTTLAVNVPTSNPDPSLNGAVTDLGFAAGDGSPSKSGATGPFLADTKLSGELTLVAAPAISATATIGFIGVTATGSASLVADGSLSIVDPKTGHSKVFITDLVDALGAGKFFTSAGGPIEGKLSGSAAAEFNVTPDLGGFSIDGISGLKATIAISLDIPDFLAAPPMLVKDPLGFGHSTINFDGNTPFTLDQTAPSNGRLTSDVSFVVLFVRRQRF